MQGIAFRRAKRTQSQLRLALLGPAGSGKTYTSLLIASSLGGRIAVIDTEHGSAKKYAGLPGIPEFDVLELSTFHPNILTEAIRAAGHAGYDVLIIDSLSHAWVGKDGALELVNRTAKRHQDSSFFAWREVTPLHDAMMEALLAAPCHVIVTLRVKMEYVVELHEGKSVPRKVGLAPIQRDGIEYLFDVVGELDHDNTLVVTKTRAAQLHHAMFPKPGAELGKLLHAWLAEGIQAAAPIVAVDAGTEELARPTSQTSATQKQLFRLVMKSGLGIEHLRQLIQEQYGVTSTHALSPEQLANLKNYYDHVISFGTEERIPEAEGLHNDV